MAYDDVLTEEHALDFVDAAESVFLGVAARKSVFVEQMVFHNAGGKLPILYLSTLSEPVSKAIRQASGAGLSTAGSAGVRRSSVESSGSRSGKAGRGHAA